MKVILNKENYFISELSENGKKEHDFYAVIALLLFVLGAFTFWEFIYEFAHMIGSIVSGSANQAMVELIRMFPLLFTALIEIYLAMFVHCAYRAGSAKKREKIWRTNGNITTVLGLFIIVYVIVGVFRGEYESIIEGYISFLFPLDMVIGGILIIAFGVFSVLYSERLLKSPSEMYFSNNIKITGRRRQSVNAFMVYSYMTALCGFAACIYGFTVLDFAHGNIFYNIMLWLNYFAAFAMFMVYRFLYCELKDEYRKSASRRFGLLFLVINAVLFGLFLAAVELQNEAPNMNAYGLLPVDFTASFNAFAALYGANNIIAPIVALLHTEKKNKKA